MIDEKTGLHIHSNHFLIVILYSSYGLVLTPRSAWKVGETYTLRTYAQIMCMPYNYLSCCMILTHFSPCFVLSMCVRYIDKIMLWWKSDRTTATERRIC